MNLADIPELELSKPGKKRENTALQSQDHARHHENFLHENTQGNLLGIRIECVNDKITSSLTDQL